MNGSILQAQPDELTNTDAKPFHCMQSKFQKTRTACDTIQHQTVIQFQFYTAGKFAESTANSWNLKADFRKCFCRLINAKPARNFQAAFCTVSSGLKHFNYADRLHYLKNCC